MNLVKNISLNKLCEQMVMTARELCDEGLLFLSAGNFSARVDEEVIAITPSGLCYDEMRPQDIVLVDVNDGSVLQGKHKPSKEFGMHQKLYWHSKNIGAVVHAHAPFTMALACSGSEIPVSSIEILGLGGPIPVAGFAVPGTPELAELAIQAFHGRPKLKAVLLQNHGSLTMGPDLEGAFRNAVKLEKGAQAHLLSLASGNRPVLIDQEAVALVRKKYLALDGATPPIAEATQETDLPEVE